jgi:hypothetical protein
MPSLFAEPFQQQWALLLENFLHDFSGVVPVSSVRNGCVCRVDCLRVYLLQHLESCGYRLKIGCVYYDANLILMKMDSVCCFNTRSHANSHAGRQNSGIL